MKHKTEKLLEIYDKLPQDVQNAFLNVDMSSTLQKIGRENKLTTEKIGILADEAGLLMLGVTHPNNFISNLDKRLQIDKETTKKIAHAVNEQIFAKIRESLRKIHNQVHLNSEQSSEQGKQEPKTTPIMPQMIKPQGYFAEDEMESKLKFTEPTTPTSVPSKPALPASKDIVEERNKKEIFRSKPEVIEKTLPPITPAPESKYDGVDPYREPIN